MPASSSQSRPRSSRTPSQPLVPTYGGTKNLSGSASTSICCIPSGAAHQIAKRASPWWLSITVRKARLPRTKKVGAPWLRRSLVCGRPRQSSRIRSRTCWWLSVIPEIYDQPGRRACGRNPKVDLLLETDGPRQHRFEVAGAHDFLDDRRPGQPFRPLVDQRPLARVQIEAGRRLHADDDEGRAVDVHDLPGAVLLQRRVRVLDAIPRKPIALELEDNPVIAFVTADCDSLEQCGRLRSGLPDHHVRTGIREGVDSFRCARRLSGGGGGRARCRRRRLALVLRAAATSRQQRRGCETGEERGARSHGLSFAAALPGSSLTIPEQDLSNSPKSPS